MTVPNMGFGLPILLLFLFPPADHPVVDGHGFSLQKLWEEAVLAQEASKNHSSAWDDTTLHVVDESSRRRRRCTTTATGAAAASSSPVVVYRSPQRGLMKADKIVKLPGEPPEGVDFSHYSGYVTVDPEAGRALFYYFVESSTAAGTSPGSSQRPPLVLWLNGGPGCSSIGRGAMTELGPFRVDKDGKTLRRNTYSWNKLANIIFLESPAGVGFSYSNTTSDYELSGDQRSAEDSYTFLVNWLARFPQYKARDLYIMGESYAGHFVPQLAYKIILQNNQMMSNGTELLINLRGIAIGNGLVDDEAHWRGILDYLWMRTLISDQIHELITSTCNFSAGATSTVACHAYVNQAFDSVGNIFVYNIYAPLCNSSSSHKYPNSSGSSTSTVADQQQAGGFDPCSDSYVAAYLNEPGVQRALHAKPTAWQRCSREIRMYWRDWTSTVLPVINHLLDGGLPIWIYSGDTDAIVPVTSSKYAIEKLNLSVETPWYPWYSQGEVGGFAVGYKGGLAFVTVRGAGHYVPSYQPARALTLFSSFLEGKLPPTEA